MLVDHGRIDDGQALAGALADRLGGEEGIEDAAADGLWNAAAVVGDADGDVPLARPFDRDADVALVAHAALQRVGHGMRRIDHQVEDHLADHVAHAVQRRQVIGVAGFKFGHVLPFAARHGDGRVDHVADVEQFLAAH